MNDKDFLKDALDAFKLASETEQENRGYALDDLKFARLGEQWPEEVKRRRELEGRPCLTINKLLTFIRQVVNDARINKPSIKISPFDSSADPDTAKLIQGLIRHIEYNSAATVAYNGALESAATMGWGYWRINVEPTFEDSFDNDIKISPIVNSFSVYGDPYSTSHDSSDWSSAFVTDMMLKKDFSKKYKGAAKVDFDTNEYKDLPVPWADTDAIMIAEYWTRTKVDKPIVKLSDGSIMGFETYQSNKDVFDMIGLNVVADRVAKTHKVKQHIISGAEVLEENEWEGRYIPIIPVFGETVVVEGIRHLRSLIRDAKDAQKMFNYWRTTSTELVALAPKAPFIGQKGAFKTDSAKWNTINTQSHSFVEYDGPNPPQRQPFSGVPAGALQEALNASDDIKSIIGIFDAGIGARSNETSGRAILARQKESDVSTFHFIDNLTRSIAHSGRVIVDLIPHVYTKDRIIRVIGDDDRVPPKSIQLNTPTMVDGVERIYDLSVGKYDVTVSSGPSFSSQREEASAQMIELLRSFPQAAPIIGDLIAKNLDWPGADEIAERLKTMLPPELQQQDEAKIPPQVQAQMQQMQQMQRQMQQQMQQGIQLIQQQQEQIKTLENDKSIELKKQEEGKIIELRKLDIDAYKAETDRLKVSAPGMTEAEVQALIHHTFKQIYKAPDLIVDPTKPIPPLGQ